MLITESEIDRIIGGLPKGTINERLKFETLVLLRRINFPSLKNEGIKYIISKKSVAFELDSLSERYCFVRIEIHAENIVTVYIGHGGEYLPNQLIETIEDVETYKAVLNELFLSSIKEEVTYCNKKITRVVYHLECEIEHCEENHEFRVIFGICFPWKKKKVTVKNFEPWI